MLYSTRIVHLNKYIYVRFIYVKYTLYERLLHAYLYYLLIPAGVTRFLKLSLLFIIGGKHELLGFLGNQKFMRNG